MNLKYIPLGKLLLTMIEVFFQQGFLDLSYAEKTRIVVFMVTKKNRKTSKKGNALKCIWGQGVP